VRAQYAPCVDCANCGTQVDEGADLCPSCGFHVSSQAAGEVRRLREEGRIRPGRLRDAGTEEAAARP
jgi:predicted amidophosphoribosyltransferase